MGKIIRPATEKTQLPSFHLLSFKSFAFKFHSRSSEFQFTFTTTTHYSSCDAPPMPLPFEYSWGCIEFRVSCAIARRTSWPFIFLKFFRRSRDRDDVKKFHLYYNKKVPISFRKMGTIKLRIWKSYRSAAEKTQRPSFDLKSLKSFAIKNHPRTSEYQPTLTTTTRSSNWR